MLAEGWEGSPNMCFVCTQLVPLLVYVLNTKDTVVPYTRTNAISLVAWLAYIREGAADRATTTQVKMIG